MGIKKKSPHMVKHFKFYYNVGVSQITHTQLHSVCHLSHTCSHISQHTHTTKPDKVSVSAV